MNCQDAQSLLYEVIDNEASPSDAQNVKAHLGECAHCQMIFEQERNLHTALRSKCCKAVESDCACDRLKTSIAERLKAVDQEESPKQIKTWLPIRIGRYAVAAAAALILVGSVGYIGWQVSEHNQAYVPLEKLHWAAAEHPENFTEANFASANTTILHDFDYHIQNSVANFNLIGSKLDTLDGVPMQHLAYSNGKAMVSVFVTPAETFIKPDDLDKAKVVKDGLTYFDHNCRGCHVVYHQEGKAMIILATTDHSIDLLDFAPGRIGI